MLGGDRSRGRLELCRGDVLLVPVEPLRPLERATRGRELGLGHLHLRLGSRVVVSELGQTRQVEHGAIGPQLLPVRRRSRGSDFDAGPLLRGWIELYNDLPAFDRNAYRSGDGPLPLVSAGIPTMQQRPSSKRDSANNQQR